MSPTMKGVKNPRRKFHSQLEAVDNAMALERYRDGYNSAQIVQMIGPQVEANPKIKKHANTIIAVPECGVAWGLFRSREKWPTDANIMKLLLHSSEMGGDEWTTRTLPDKHPTGSKDQGLSTTKVFHYVKAEESRSKIDST